MQRPGAHVHVFVEDSRRIFPVYGSGDAPPCASPDAVIWDVFAVTFLISPLVHSGFSLSQPRGLPEQFGHIFPILSGWSALLPHPLCLLGHSLGVPAGSRCTSLLSNAPNCTLRLYLLGPVPPPALCTPGPPPAPPLLPPRAVHFTSALSSPKPGCLLLLPALQARQSTTCISSCPRGCFQCLFSSDPC